MAKKITTQFKLMAPGGQATPAPPLGPVLGANGVNPGQFITQFNDTTRELNGKLVGCIVTVFEDRSFELEIKSSPASTLIMEKAKVKKGASEIGSEIVGTITFDDCRDIAREKFSDMNAFDVDAAARTIAGTARSMGVAVEGL
ncbi:MAG: 50S ribosomal protein L11 [Phycisphaerae bacterium]|nr:50S ribosomal protein L11 [Phycisphaerae bacterium]